MRDKTLEELTDGLMGQFRVVRERKGDLSDELKIADSMANMAGKVLKMYMVELAYHTADLELPQTVAQDAKLLLGERTA